MKLDIAKIQARLEAAHNRRQARYEAEHNKDKKKSWFKPYNRTKFEFAVQYRPRLGIFKYKRRSECTFDPKSFEAYSYGHWRFVWLQKGKIVFNDYSYSVTTSSHQGSISALLRELGLKPYIRADLGRSGHLDNLYSQLFQLEVEHTRKNARVSRTVEINSLKKLIAKCESIGLRLSLGETKQSIQTRINSNEARRLEGLATAKAARQAIRDRIKVINTTDPLKLNVSEVETEENAEIRRMLVNRIGLVRVLKELNAQVLDVEGDYQLVNLSLKADSERPAWDRTVRRPYLKMVNPSTGEIHVEGVAPHIETVQQALAWRNGLNEFVKPIKIT